MFITVKECVNELNNTMSFKGETDIGTIAGLWMSRDILPEPDVCYDCEVFLAKVKQEEMKVTKNDNTPSRVEVGLSDKVYMKGIVEAVGENLFTVSFGDWIESFEMTIPGLKEYDSISFILDKSMICVYALTACES